LSDIFALPNELDKMEVRIFKAETDNGEDCTLISNRLQSLTRVPFDFAFFVGIDALMPTY
jgi:hypothetical protein